MAPCVLKRETLLGPMHRDYEYHGSMYEIGLINYFHVRKIHGNVINFDLGTALRNAVPNGVASLILLSTLRYMSRIELARF